jgi:hypothetical protein
MDALDLESEVFPPTGAIAAEGARKALGRPALDPLAVLVREAVQNSWDAKKDVEQSVAVRFETRELTADQVDFLKRTVMKEKPQVDQLKRLLTSKGPVRILTIADYGTSGLGGPSRADLPPAAGESRDFVDFFRNVGQPSDKPLGGGTYGYGKASLYVNSSVRTICAYTRTHVDGRERARFMGSAWGRQFTARKQFTGRHWWGVKATDGHVDPAEGASANACATGLGLPLRSPGETGTTLMVLAPAFGEREPLDAMNLIAENLLWYFWPKMLEDGTQPPQMTFSVECDDSEIAVPHPDSFPPLQGFATALRQLKKARSQESTTAVIRPLECERPRKHLGILALERFAALPRVNGEGPLGSRARHVALMRNAELVVRYVEGPQLPTDAIEYGGVFIPAQDIDAVYADAEPPTHDDWSADMLEDPWHKRYIRTTFKRLREVLDEFTGPPVNPVDDSIDVPLGSFAEHLAGLFPGAEGTGPTVQPPGPTPPGPGTGGTGGGGGGGRGPLKGRAYATGPGVLCEFNGQRVVRVAVKVEPGKGAAATRVVADARVMVMDGRSRETDPPEGSQVPALIAWERSDGKIMGTATDVIVPRDVTDLTAVVTVPEDGLVQVRFSAESASTSTQ